MASDAHTFWAASGRDGGRGTVSPERAGSPQAGPVANTLEKPGPERTRL